MVEMKVEGLTLDPLTNMPIIILKDSTGVKALPIWVGNLKPMLSLWKLKIFPHPVQ